MGTHAGRLSENQGERTDRGYDLLRIQAVRRLVLWSAFPYVFQILFLAVFVSIAVIGWGNYAPEGVPGKLYAKTNLVNLVIWGLWWPTMVWVAVLFGRLWCMVCPLELVSNVTERIGHLAGIRQRHLPKWLRAGWLILILYVLIQMLVAGIHLHRIPMHTAVFMFILLIVSGLTGLLYKDRAFCRGFCPVGLLLNVYGRGGMLAVRANQRDACGICESKDCILQSNRTLADARSCPSLLNPPKLDTNKDCLVCVQCFKACEPNNLQLLLRRPFSRWDARERLASWPTMLFVLVVSGFVTYEVVGGWPGAKAVFLWVPEQMSTWLGLAPSNGWLKSVWMLIVFPSIVWTALGALMILLGSADGLGQAWRRMALPMAVVVASAHMAKGLDKISTWGGYLPMALQDPQGVQAAVAVNTQTMPTPNPLIPHPLYAALGIVIIAAGLCFGIREAKLADPSSPWRGYGVSLALVALLFAGCVLGWGFK